MSGQSATSFASAQRAWESNTERRYMASLDEDDALDSAADEIRTEMESEPLSAVLAQLTEDAQINIWGIIDAELTRIAKARRASAKRQAEEDRASDRAWDRSN